MDNNAVSLKAIQAVSRSSLAYCKFLSSNDTGDTGAHQAGIYIAKESVPILFDQPGIRGENKDRFVTIRWQDDFTTESRFIYYGKGTRDEYRITRFGHGFPFLHTEHTGDLFVLAKENEEEYSAYVLSTEEDINGFLDAFGLSPSDTGHMIQKEDIRQDTQVELAVAQFISTLQQDFPTSAEMSAAARDIFNRIFDHEENIRNNPDSEILSWLDMEYRLFRKIEFARYGAMITEGFTSVEQFIEVANMVLNRRKSRAGKSLEHHLAAIFDGNALPYAAQPYTEGSRQPDFLFPGEAPYHNAAFPADRLIFLGAKTTCKDRWRQVLNEAGRIPEKHLFTLQQGISAQQLDEMAEERVILVVPKPYIDTYPREKRAGIWTLDKFIGYVREKTEA